MKTVIIGATGATGQALLQLLLADEAVTEVRVLVRKPLMITHPKLIVYVIDFNKSEQWQSHVTGDMAFSCLGTTLKAAGSKEAQYKVDYEYQYVFAKAASENGVPGFIIISAGMANPKSLVFYSRMKGRLEKAVEALDFKYLVIFRPGLLSRPGTDRRGEKISEGFLKFFNRLGMFKALAPLPVQQLARLMLHYAKKRPTGRIQIIESAKILEDVKLG